MGQNGLNMEQSFVLEDLSNNIYSIKVGLATFFCRGLTVIEYINVIGELTSTVTKSIGKEIWIKVAYCGIVDWINYRFDESNFDTDSNLLPYSEHNKELVSVQILEMLGKKIYHELSEVTNNDEIKFRGYIRFSNFINDEKSGPHRKKTFECDYCVKHGLFKFRTCSNPNLDKLIASGGLDVKDRKSKSAASKYSTTKRRSRFQNEDEFEETQKKTANSNNENKVIIGDVAFPECPVFFIDAKSTVLCGVLYHCAITNKNFFDGGVAKQPYKLHRLQELVNGEHHKIQAEDMKKK